MDILEKVIFSLTSDEVRRFKILSNRFKADDEKKLLILFDIIRSEKYKDEEQEIVKELYVQNNAQTRNRYYRLRNKLLENIEKSLAFYHFKYKDSIHAYYDIQLSIMFRERGGYQLAQYFLKKAEKKAKELDQFHILEQIYHEYMQLAMKDIELDIEEVIERRKVNLEKVKVYSRNTEAIALLTQQLKKSNFSRDKSSILDLLEKNKQNIEASADIFNSPEGKIQIFRTVSTLLLQKEAYAQLVTFLYSSIEDLESHGQFNNDNHSDRLLMRLWLVNALFKTRNFAESESQLAIFEKEMVMYKRQNYFTYLFHYTNARINALKFLGRNDEAGEVVKEALNTREMRSEPEQEVYLLRSFADYQFLSGKMIGAIASIHTIKIAKGYELLSALDKFYLAVFEMVVRIEAGEYDVVLDDYPTFKKEHKRLLKSDSHERVSLFVEILLKLCSNLKAGKPLNLKAQLPKLQAMFHDNEQGNNEILLYDLYLESKLSGKNYYELFIAKMRSQQG